MRQYLLRKRTLLVLCSVISLLVVNQYLATAPVRAVTGGRQGLVVPISGEGAPNTGGDHFKHEVSAEAAAVKGFVSRHSFTNRPRPLDGTEADRKQVRIVYLVPSDKPVRTAYETGIRDAIIHLQAFYQTQLGGGYTFSLHSPIVEVYRTTHPSSFYSSGQNASALGFFFSVLEDGFALSGGRFDDPNYRYVYYIDADPACGQVIGALFGVALNAANDLRGLTGQDDIPICPGHPPDTTGLCRWVGGLGHELGHTFGLPHPPGCDQGTCSSVAFNALMFLGYVTYQNTYLLEEEKAQLLATGFFTVQSPYTYSSDCRPPPAFDLCLQDEGSGNILRVNTGTGGYSFTDCRTGLTLSGEGSLKVKACIVHLQDKKDGPGKPDRKVNVIVHTCSNKANGVIQSLATNTTFTMNDGNTLDSTCGCP